MTGRRMAALSALACVAFGLAAASAATVELNPVNARPVEIGPHANRFVVRFRVTPANQVTRSIRGRSGPGTQFPDARTASADVDALMQRAHVRMAGSRQLTPSMHVVYLGTTLYGGAATAALQALRADPAVEFADVDQWRYPHALPDDPLFVPSADASGQWYMMTPSAATATSDAAGTDAVSAWAVATGSTGTVIADIDTGVRFDHPDLKRAGLGGRLLPGYDFVSGDYNSAGAALGTYLIANDGDGWDPDPSDPGDWISRSDQSNALFPAATCPIADSSWHGTRVMGILGALTNNAVGIAGMTWNPYLLPVRALGKCGGYDSDIIAGMEWAAGLGDTLAGVPANPYPADIINLSLGGSGKCPSDYLTAIADLSKAGVLVVASAGNASGPVDAPGNCAGVLAVAGLRNIGTKVGYSSLGAEVAVSAPAGNCVTSAGACLRSIDTTTNSGLTVPADSTYTNQSNPNLGTSFSAPIVSGVAALMRAVNANLSPAQLIARIESSAAPFPQPAGLPVCPSADAGSGECACPNDATQCGAGMVNALRAVNAALRPIAAVNLPATTAIGVGAVLDASGSAASCGRTVTAYQWTATGGVTLQTATSTAAATTATPTGTPGTITLTVTDSAGAIDVATIAVTAAGALAAGATTPVTAGTPAGACPVPLTVNPASPTVTADFSPAAVGENVVSMLTLTLANANGFALTQSSLTETLPAGLDMAKAATAAALAPATTCTGSAATLSASAASVTLSNAIIPARSSCTITVPVQSAANGSYLNTIAVNALSTGPAGQNAVAAGATLTVRPPSTNGGGQLDWWDSLFIAGVLLAGRRHGRRKP